MCKRIKQTSSVPGMEEVLFLYSLPLPQHIYKLFYISEMLASMNRPAIANLNRERKVRYQHPKGAPDADKIFGSKWVSQKKVLLFIFILCVCVRSPIQTCTFISVYMKENSDSPYSFSNSVKWFFSENAEYYTMNCYQ